MERVTINCCLISPSPPLDSAVHSCNSCGKIGRFGIHGHSRSTARESAELPEGETARAGQEHEFI